MSDTRGRIYILTTPIPGGGQEHRVMRVENIDLIYDRDDINHDALVGQFSSAPVYTEWGAAYGLAQEMADQYNEEVYRLRYNEPF